MKFVKNLLIYIFAIAIIGGASFQIAYSSAASQEAPPVRVEEQQPTASVEVNEELQGQIDELKQLNEQLKKELEEKQKQLEDQEEGKRKEPLPNEDAVFVKFTKENFEKIKTREELQRNLEEVGLLLAEDFDIEPYNIELEYTENNYYGYCHYNSRRIVINLPTIFETSRPYEKIISTLAHEYRHAEQHQRVDDNGKDWTLLETSLTNYIRPEDDENGYYLQLCEKDARLFSEYYLDYVKQRLQLISNKSK